MEQKVLKPKSALFGLRVGLHLRPPSHMTFVIPLDSLPHQRMYIEGDNPCANKIDKSLWFIYLLDAFFHKTISIQHLVNVNIWSDGTTLGYTARG